MRSRRGAALLLATGLLLVVGSAMARAQTAPTLVNGIKGKSASDGIGFTFGDPTSQPYPTAAGQLAHTEASLTTGPSGYALASVSWPGPLAGNAGSLAVLLGAPPEAGQANDPVRAEAYSAGPNDAELPGMRAHAEGGVAEATALAKDTATAPGVGAGDVSTVSRTESAGTSLVSSSNCTATDIGADQLHIGSVHSEASATSDGDTSSSGGRTVVSGVTIAGQPAEVDEEGVRFTDPVTAPIGEQILSQMGMEMFVASPQSSQSGAQASYRAGALVIVWEPPSSGQLFVYSICGSEALASVRLGAGALPPAPLTPTTAPISGARPSPSAAAPTASPAAPTPTPTTTPAAAPAETIAAAPAAFVRHLGLWPYVVGALACVAGAYGLGRARTDILAPRAVAAPCPLEGGRP